MTLENNSAQHAGQLISLPMKTSLTTLTVSLFAVLTLAATTAMSAPSIYSDSTGAVEGPIVSSNPHIDITSVEVNNTASDLIFKINLAGNPVATDWGKYMVGIHTGPGGDAAGNGWVRPISMPIGMNYWIGSWVDSGNGIQLWNYTGSWTQIGGPPALPGLSISKDASSVTLSAPLASMGLGVGSVINFDVYTSGGGGGDSAIDALANPGVTVANWGDPYSSQTTDAYTIAPVPEPASCILFGFGGLILFGRVLRQRS